MRIFYSNLSSSIFTLKTLLIVLFTSLPFIIQAQEIPSSLIDRANDTRFIFEGVVINSEPYYNSSGTYVYTSNTVEITRLLKGDIECGTIEIITEGGTYNGTTFEKTHSLVLSQGSRGIFLCNETNRPLSTIDFYPESNVQKLEATFENQSFIRYWWDGDGVNAADIWANYDSLAAVYDITELVTGLHYYDCNSGLDMESPGKNLPSSFPKPNSQAVNEKPRYSKEEFNSVMEYHRYKRENFKVEGVNATGTVTYDMENFKISGDSPKFVEFDVTIKDNLGTKYMQFGAVRISYDSFIFGSSIVANNQVTVSRGTLNSDPNCYIDPIPQDHTGSTILISASETNASQCKAQVLTTPQSIMHVKIEMPNCITSHQIELVDTAMIGIPEPSMILFLTGYSNSASDPNYYEYSNLNHNDLENINSCGAKITSFAPSALAGGIEDTLRIFGEQFGFSRGSSKIYMKNADDGGNSEVFLDNYDIVSWSDTLIKVLVPSYDSSIVGGITHRGDAAGSGDFRIATTSSTAYSSNALQAPLKVSYSIKTRLYSGTGKVIRPIAPPTSMNQKIIFRCDTTVAQYQNGAMKAIIDKALRDWTCLTGIEWELGADIASSQTGASADNECIIQFIDGTGQNKLAAASSISTTCSGGSEHYIREIDIVIDSTRNWHVDSTSIPVPGSDFDFYSVILHELGHALGLDHIIDNAAIMHYSIAAGVKKRDLEHDISCDLGGNWSMAYMRDPANTVSCRQNVNSSLNPICSKVSINQENLQNLQFDVFPNPTGDYINIQFKGNEPEEYIGEITDVFGRKVYEFTIPSHKNSNFQLNLSELPAGYYWLSLSKPESGLKETMKILKYAY